jgi:anti-anti-sigma regulatory factor
MIDMTTDNDTQIITPQNNLVGEVSNELTGKLDQLIANGHTKLKIDFSKVSKIDSTAVSAILLTKKKLHPDTEIEMINMERKMNAFFSSIRIQTSPQEDA